MFRRAKTCSKQLRTLNPWLSHLSLLSSNFMGIYVDDTMRIIQGSDVDSFTEHLNSIHPAIKFTVEHEQENKLRSLCWTLSFIKTRRGVCLSVCIKNPRTLTSTSTSPLIVINHSSISWASFTL